MLTLFAKHGGFNLSVVCKGDTYVDFHHTTEDIGIVLGAAFEKALGDKKGITRYGSMMLPMDESLILSAVDISGRSFLAFDLETPSYKVGDFDTELVEEFFRAFSSNAKLNLHIKKLYGTNSHHIIEGAFKSVARSLRAAVKIDPEFSDAVPSTKGVL
jgi:imidazoleglycerol-phosphate dehydratase